MDRNDPLLISLRRHRDTLTIAGSGIALLGFWMTAEALIFTAIFVDERLRANPQEGTTPLMAVTLAVVAFVMGLDLLLRLYIGLNARAEGRGERRHPAYLVVAALALLFNVAFIAASVLFVATGSESPFGFLMSLITQGISILTFGQLISASLSIRRINKALD